MRRSQVLAGAGAAIVVIVVIAFLLARRQRVLVLTGTVTTHDVIVSSQVGGRVDSLLVREGDGVKPGELLAVIAPAELAADSAYYAHTARGMAQQVSEGQAALRYEARQTADDIARAEATLAATEAERAAAAATLESARLAFERDTALIRSHAIAQAQLDRDRAAWLSAEAQVAAADKQVAAQEAAVSLARASAEQVAMRRSAVAGARQQQAAAQAQAAKAAIRLGYTELRAPIAGIVDVRAARQGEVVAAGAPVLTLVNPDDLWIRADIEESYIPDLRLGDSLTVRLPSGATRRGVVFYRAVDAAFATQRDVSRTKRDIRTFEIRVRVDNRDRALALGMTAYVRFPVPR